MGLDMYLSATKYHSKGLSKMDNELEAYESLKKALNCDEFISDNLGFIKSAVEVAYWRKVNSVHQWFVDNCQNGEDDCRKAYVSREKLIELRDICQEILADHSLAEELLPTQSGFFFGSTEFDEYYFSDLEDTVQQLNNALVNVPEGWDFEYQSSW